MKKIIVIFAFLALSPLAQAAHKSYGSAGCGLGNMLLGKHDNQILAATTNGTSWNQTFGISSGTSNCVDSGAVRAAKAVTVFIELNHLALADDIAKGHGEHLASLAQLLKCQDQHDFGTQMQRHYQVIFPDAQTPSNKVESSIRELIHSEKDLAQNCVG
jgi:hypothetical protein